MLKDIIVAIRSFRQAHRFIREHKLWRWIIVPGVIYVALFCISMYFFGKSVSYAIGWMNHQTGIQQWIADRHSDFLSLLFTVAAVILWLILMLLYLSLFKYIWLIVGSPVFAFLSGKTEEIIEKRGDPFRISQVLKDIFRGITIALRNTVWQSVYLVSLVLASFIPVVGWVVPVFALLIECYYYGFSMLDYSLERHELSVSESLHFIRARRGLAIGNGLIFYAMHLIPVVGWLFAPGYAVIAATLSIRIEKKGDPIGSDGS